MSILTLVGSGARLGLAGGAVWGTQQLGIWSDAKRGEQVEITEIREITQRDYLWHILLQDYKKLKSGQLSVKSLIPWTTSPLSCYQTPGSHQGLRGRVHGQ